MGVVCFCPVGCCPSAEPLISPLPKAAWAGAGTSAAEQRGSGKVDALRSPDPCNLRDLPHLLRCCSLPVMGLLDSASNVVGEVGSHVGRFFLFIYFFPLGPSFRFRWGFSFIPLLLSLGKSLVGRPRISLDFPGPFTSAVKSHLHLCCL